MTGRCEQNNEDSGQAWAALSAAVTGGGHLERGVPCQDRAAAWAAPRPCAIVLDGRGSARRSHDGAEAAITALRQRLLELETELAQCLDRDDPALARVAWKGVASQLNCTAAREQRRLSEASGLPAGDFEFTLSLTVSGRTSTGWMCVGDSPIVVQRAGVLAMPFCQTGGSFANQTHFVQARPDGPLNLHGGIFSSTGLEAMLLMSDGTATKFIDLTAQVPAEANRQLADLLSTGDLTEANLTGMLAAENWNATTRDDRSLAMLVPNALADAMPHAPFAEDMDSGTPEEPVDEDAFSPAILAFCLAPLVVALLAVFGCDSAESLSAPHERLATLPAVLRLQSNHTGDDGES